MPKRVNKRCFPLRADDVIEVILQTDHSLRFVFRRNDVILNQPKTGTWEHFVAGPTRHANDDAWVEGTVQLIAASLGLAVKPFQGGAGWHYRLKRLA